MTDTLTLSAYIDEIANFIDIDRSDEAITLCKHILRYYPKHIDTYRLMAEAMLKQSNLESAQELFRRVLSADPENVVAYARLATIFEKQHEIAEALWHLERAYELAPTHQEIRTQLLRLYTEIEGKPRERLKLTSGALARLYVQEGLFAQAIQEFRTIGSSELARYDARVALAESLWRADRVREAAEVAQNLLQLLPYCLKANLILGTLWHESELEESGTYLERAQALDPMNQTAQALLGARSPLHYRQVLVPRYVEGETPAPEPEPEPVSPADITPSFDQFFPEPTTETPPMVEPAAAETSTLESNVPPSQEQLESSEPAIADSDIPAWLRDNFLATQAESPASEPNVISSSPQAGSTELQETRLETTESEEQVETPTPRLLSWLEEAPQAEEQEGVSGAPSVAGAEKPTWLEEIDRAKEPVLSETKEEDLSAPVETRVEETEQAPARLGEPPAQPASTEISPAAQEKTPETNEPVAAEQVSRETPMEEPKIPAWVKVLSQRPAAVEEQASTEGRAPAPTEAPREEPTKPKLEFKRQPRGFDRLVQARQHRDANRLEDALTEYDYLVQHVPRLLKDLIDDLEQLTKREDAPLETHRILGDAYARADRLAEALERYRFVMERVSHS